MLKNISRFKKYALYALGALGVAAVVCIAIRLMPNKNVSQESSRAFKVEFGGTPAVPPSPPGSVTMEYAPAPSESAPSFDSVSEKGVSQSNQQVETERKVVKKGSLSLTVKKAGETAEKIQSVAGGFGGFTDDVDIYSVSEISKSGSVTIRVPAAKFDEAMKKIKELAIKVDREEIVATDITAEFTDLEAWLKNLKAEEQQYVKILAKADTIEDILNVTQYLSSVRGGIERLQAKINYLSAQVEMSAITVSLTEEADVELFGIHWRPLFTIKQSFRNMLAGLSGYVDSMIGFIFYLPALILWIATFVAAFWALRKIYKSVKAKFFKK
jgi:chemotaxis protein histidine kinase CheA